MLLPGVPAVRAAEPAWPRSQQVHFMCLLSAVPLFHRKMKPHEELPSDAEHSLSPPQKAVGLHRGPSPWARQCLHSPLSIAPSLSPSAMEAAVEKSHPVPSSDPLMATAGIPHVAAYLSLQSCKQVAGVLPQHFFPLAQVGSEHPTAGSSPGGSA